MSAGEPIAWVDGRIGPATEARIPILDHGFLFGDGVFEGIRVTERGIFRLDDHMKRLETAGRALGIGAEAVFDRAREAACETTRAFGRQEGYLRLIVTRGVGALGIDPATCRDPAIVCIAAGALAPDPEREARGLSLVTSSLGASASSFEAAPSSMYRLCQRFIIRRAAGGGSSIQSTNSSRRDSFRIRAFSGLNTTVCPVALYRTDRWPTLSTGREIRSTS